MFPIHLNPHMNLAKIGKVWLILDPSLKHGRLMTVIVGYLHLPTYTVHNTRLFTVIYSYLRL